jgi:hypothetical protein
MNDRNHQLHHLGSSFHPDSTAVVTPLASFGAETPGADSLIRLELEIRDPEILEALASQAEGRERNEFARSALKIGVLAIKHAAGRIDGERIRAEGERLLAGLQDTMASQASQAHAQMVGSLREYFDPHSGRFPERVERFVKQDGELATLMRQQITATEEAMIRAFETYVGEQSAFLKRLNPAESNELILAIRAGVERSVAESRDHLLREFSLDNGSGALSHFLREVTAKHGALTDSLGQRIDRVVAEFSLDESDSALSRLVRQMDEAQRRISSEFSLDATDSALARMRRELLEVLEADRRAAGQFQEKVLATVEAMNARKEAERRSTIHGHSFQSAAFVLINRLCQDAGDVAEDIGHETGVLGRSKKGDFVITLGADSHAQGARIVIETKEDASYTLKRALAELDEARKNRQAGVGLFVHSKRSAPAGMRPLRRYGNDIVIVWDAEDEASDVVLEAGLAIAKWISIHERREDEKAEADAREVEAAIHAIDRQLEGFDEIRTKTITIKNAADAIDGRARIMGEQIRKKLAVLG